MMSYNIQLSQYLFKQYHMKEYHHDDDIRYNSTNLIVILL